MRPWARLLVHQSRYSSAASRTSTQDIVHHILGTCTPSPREAASYIRRYDLAQPNSAIHIALIQLQWPVSSPEAVARNLVALHRLSVIPLILLDVDPPLDPPNDEPGARHLFTPTHLIPPLANRDPLAFRSAQVSACHQVARVLHDAGAVARPIPTSVFHLITPTSHQLPTVDVSPLKSCLDNGTIPILAPLATTWDSSRTVPLSIAHTMMALASSLSSVPTVSFLGPLGSDASSLNPTQQFIKQCVPTKLIIINRSRGGIPSNMHCTSSLSGRAFINLAMEFDTISNDISASAKDDLCQTQRVLLLMPPSATAMIASASTSESVVSHFLTDKPLVSVSLPKRARPSSISVRPAPAEANEIPPTVLRLGVPIRILHDYNEIDEPKLTALLESSFARRLDTHNYYNRLRKRMYAVIIAGDYVGAVIVTKEGVPYLDKFAVSPKVQSGGVADILWMALRDQVCPDQLVWRSRLTNEVNPWYFARADGMIKLGALPNTPSLWTVFWYSGRVAPSLIVRQWDVPINTYLDVASNIPPSFV